MTMSMSDNIKVNDNIVNIQFVHLLSEWTNLSSLRCPVHNMTSTPCQSKLSHVVMVGRCKSAWKLWTSSMPKPSTRNLWSISTLTRRLTKRQMGIQLWQCHWHWQCCQATAVQFQCHWRGHNVQPSSPGSWSHWQIEWQWQSELEKVDTDNVRSHHNFLSLSLRCNIVIDNHWPAAGLVREWHWQCEIHKQDL